MEELEAKSINLGTTRMKYYLHEGREDEQGTVVLLHPWFGCWEFWTQTLEVTRGRSYAVDFYSLWDREWSNFGSPLGLAAAVMLLVGHEKLGKFSLVGNSMGGIAAQCVAAMCPEKVEKLVLIGTGAVTSNLKSDYAAALQNWIADPNPANSEAMLGRLIARRPDSQTFSRYLNAVVSANKEFMKSVLTHAFHLDLKPFLSNILARTLIIRGELDQGRTHKDVEILLNGIRSSQSVEIGNAGHSPMVDSFSTFAPILTGFLNG